MDKKNIAFQKLKNFVIQNHIPVWPFGKKNAYLVTSVGILYNNIFTFLTSYIFTEDLCLHISINQLDEEFNILYLEDNELEDFKFFNSGLTQKQYYEKYISIFSNYKKFFYSAVLYHLEVSIKEDNLPLDLRMLRNNNLASFMYLFSRILIANQTYTPILYKDMKNINIFSLFPLECLNGFFGNFTDVTIVLNYNCDDTKAFLATEKRHNVFRFLNMFSFYFSPKFRATCFKDCVKTNNYIPMFLALKIYQTTLLFPKLTLTKLNEVQCISGFKEILIATDSISEENLNKLIEKNWRYHNYE